MLKNKKFSKIKYCIPICIGCVIIMAMVWTIGIRNFYTTLLKCNMYLLSAASFLCFLVLITKLIRWSGLFREAKTTDAYRVYLIGQAMNEVAPIGTGELTRAYIAKSKLKISVGNTLTSAIVERLGDTTFLIAITIIYLAREISGVQYGWQISTFVIIIFVCYVFLIKPQLLDRLARFFKKIFRSKTKFSIKINNYISTLLDSLKNAVLKFHERRSVLVQTILLTIIAWSIEAMAQKILLHSFGIGMNISLFNLLGIIAASWILGTFSFLPGGLGAREAIFTLLLNIYGVPIEVGISVALIYRGIAYCLLGTGATASLISFGSSKPQRFESNFK